MLSGNPAINVVSFQECAIRDCGEIPEGEDDGFVVDDGTGDKYAEFPTDSGIDFLSVSSKDMYVLCSLVTQV